MHMWPGVTVRYISLQSLKFVNVSRRVTLQGQHNVSQLKTVTTCPTWVGPTQPNDYVARDVTSINHASVF